MHGLTSGAWTLIAYRCKSAWVPVVAAHVYRDIIKMRAAGLVLTAQRKHDGRLDEVTFDLLARRCK